LIEQLVEQFGAALGDYGPVGIQALKIIWINILLSGDNAIVIALACRALPPRQRFWGIILGAGAAVLLRIFFTVILQYVLELPWLKLVGGILLLWIAIKLLIQDEADEASIDSADNLWGAVRTVAIADIVMSLDNVLAIAAAAKGNTALIVFGLAFSIPLIVAGATLIMALLTRFPVLVWAGAALLGWIAGELIVGDRIALQQIQDWNPALVVPDPESAIGVKTGPMLHYVAATIGTAIVLLWGCVLLRRRSRGAVGVPGEEGGPAE
jgi:YjbE family integral membrane protein